METQQMNYKGGAQPGTMLTMPERAGCTTAGCPVQCGRCGQGEGIDYLVKGQQMGPPQYEGAGPMNSEVGIPGMYIGVAARPDGGYQMMAFIPGYALQGKEGKAFADYLANGGMREIIEAMLPYANSAASKGEAKKSSYANSN